MLTALIFGTDRETSTNLQQLCSLTQDVCVYRTVERYPPAHETIRLLNSYAPQLVFLGMDDEVSAQAVEQDIRSTQPSTAILGVSSRSKAVYAFETPFGGFPVYPVPVRPMNSAGAWSISPKPGASPRGPRLLGFSPAKPAAAPLPTVCS